MISKLIINADDFGLTKGVNRGIIECHEAGVVTSTTLMVQGAAAEEAATLAAQIPGLGIGLHLNLTAGLPVLSAGQVPSLVNRNGVFPGKGQMLRRLTTGRVRTRDLLAEIEAQIARCRVLGVEPTHVDSHHHIHAHPYLRVVLRRACRSAGIEKMRNYKTLSCSTSFAAMALWSAELLAPGKPLDGPTHLFGVDVMANEDYTAHIKPLLEKCAGTLEVMCHPGYYDKTLETVTSYGVEREAELRSLLDSKLARLLRESDIEMVSYREL
jgi:predicted glycoside hydrolase/deacetylase ChbG (UPF0249 family)